MIQTKPHQHSFKDAFQQLWKCENIPPKHISTISLRVVRPSAFSFSTRYRANSSIRKPWPTSPNMTANKKGNVTMVKIYAKNPVVRSCSHPVVGALIIIIYAGPTQHRQYIGTGSAVYESNREHTAGFASLYLAIP